MTSATEMPMYQCIPIAREMIWPFTGTDQINTSQATNEAVLTPSTGARMTNRTTRAIVRMDPQAMMQDTVGTSRCEKPVARSTIQ